MGIVGYILGTLSRKRAIKAREMAERAARGSTGSRRRRPPQPRQMQAARRPLPPRAMPCRADGKRTVG